METFTSGSVSASGGGSPGRLDSYPNPFYKAEKSVSYKHIEALFHDGKDCQQVIDWKLIQTHWFDMMRVVLSIREGKISSATILRKLGNYSRKNRLYQAFRELGRAVRTEFLLRYIQDIVMREKITAGMNKAEATMVLRSGYSSEERV